MPSVTIAGIGVNATVDVEEGASIADALRLAATSLDGGLQARVGGQVVDEDYVPEDGDTVVVTPPQAKLGA